MILWDSTGNENGVQGLPCRKQTKVCTPIDRAAWSQLLMADG